MDKEQLVETIKRILNTDSDLSFLLRLRTSELERLVACVRARIDQKDHR
jgi:hypothetical protein